MGSLFSKPKLPAPPPQIDDAIARRNAQDRGASRGRGTTILTSDSGLPNLGSTTRATAGGS